MDYSAILQFYPLLQQQQQLLQANAQHAAMLAAMQQAAQAQQTAARAAAQPPAAAYASYSSEPIPHINTALSSNVSLLAEIESEWRWGSVCLFFEHFLPLYPNRKLQFKPELLMQSFLCTHHSCAEHKWDACSCPHPACQQLAGLFLQLLLMLHPIPEACKKMPKNQMNITNYLPVLQNLIEKAYFAPNQTSGAREQIQEIMQLLIDDIAAKKEAEREEKLAKAQAEGESADMNDDDNNDDDGAKGGAKGSLKFSLPITPPGSALLASHLHQLPALCKLYLLHFVCDYVLSEVDTLKEACTQSNLLAHGGGAAASTAGTAASAAAAAAATILPANPFHSRGLSEPHGRDDDGAAYWCFVHEEMGRVHLWRDVHTGAKDEFHVRLRRKGSDKLPQTKVHGDEPDDPDADDAEAIDLLESDEVEPIDADHAPPSFSFTLLASDLDAVQALVSVWAVTWKEVDGLVFLHKLKSDVLPNALLMQKKAERISRRDKTSRGSAAWTPPEFVGAQRWSSRTRKQVNYAELAEGDTSTAAAAAAEADEEYDADASVGSKRSRRSTAGVSPAPFGSAAAATTQPAAAYTAEQAASMQQQQQNMQNAAMMSMWAQMAMNQQAQAAAAAARQATPTLAPIATANNAQIPPLGAAMPTPSPVASVTSNGSMAPVHTPASVASPSPVSIAAVQQQPAVEPSQLATPAASPMPDADAVMRAAAAASAVQSVQTTPAPSPVAAAMPAEAASSPAASPTAEQPAAAAATVAAQ